MPEREKSLRILLKGRALERMDRARDVMNELFFFGSRVVTWETLVTVMLELLNEKAQQPGGMERIRELAIEHKPKMGPRKRKDEEVDSWT